MCPMPNSCQHAAQSTSRLVMTNMLEEGVANFYLFPSMHSYVGRKRTSTVGNQRAAIKIKSVRTFNEGSFHAEISRDSRGSVSSGEIAEQKARKTCLKIFPTLWSQ